ncbi:hypothetical protein HQ520_16300 [bacterium]|nr:hypothetical protein [bacterium]
MDNVPTVEAKWKLDAGKMIRLTPISLQHHTGIAPDPLFVRANRIVTLYPSYRQPHAATQHAEFSGTTIDIDGAEMPILVAERPDEIMEKMNCD